MSSYFPYNEDEWEKIVEQAFAADAAEPQFSKAYQRRKRRMERKMMRTRCCTKKKVGIFLAAVAAGMLGIAAAAPAVASSDAVKGIYAFFGSEKYYTKNPVEKNDLTSYAKKEDETQKTEDGTIRMENIYCDGNHLSVTLRLTNLPEALQNSTGIESEFTGTLNGQKLSFIGSTGTYTMSTKTGGLATLSEQAEGAYYDKENTSIAGFVKSGDAEYSIVLSAECSEIFQGNTTASLPLQLSFSFLQGIDATSWSWFETGVSAKGDTAYSCEPRSLGVIPVDITLTAEIQADTSRTDIYPVTETKDGYTLESVTVSPFSTEIRFSEDTVFDDYDVMYVTDQNGNSYDMIDANIDTDISFQNSVWEAALTDATELTIRIVPEGKNNLDAAGTVFTVPIDKGYRTQTINDFDLAENYTQYIPPMPDEESASQ